MTKLSEHNKSILHAIADGKEIESKHSNMSAGDCWFVESIEWTLSFLYNSDYVFRIKPTVRSINGIEFAAPVKEGGIYELVLRMSGCGLEHAWKFAEARDREIAYWAARDALEGKIK